MKKRHFVACLVLIITLAPVWMRSQVCKSPSYPWESELVSRQGWDIPGLYWIETHPAPTSTRNISVTGVEVRVATFSLPIGELGENPAVDIPTIRTTQTEAIFETMHAVAVKVNAYANRKRVFCYEVTVLPYGCNEEKKCGYAGAGFEFRFYDKDGDGIFETLGHAGLSYDSLGLEIPTWIRNNSLKPVP